MFPYKTKIKSCKTGNLFYQENSEVFDNRVMQRKTETTPGICVTLAGMRKPYKRESGFTDTVLSVIMLALPDNSTSPTTVLNVF